MADSNDELLLKAKADTKQATADVKELSKAVQEAGKQSETSSKKVVELGSATDSTAKSSKEAAKAVDGLAGSSKQASDGMQNAGEAVDSVGKKADKAKGSIKDVTKELFEMSSRELGERILEIGGRLDHIGNIAKALAEGDIEKVKTGFESLAYVATVSVGAIAPAFAPLVAIIGVVIGKIVQWSDSVKEAGEASKKSAIIAAEGFGYIDAQLRLAIEEAHGNQAKIDELEKRRYETRLGFIQDALNKEKELHGEASAEYLKLSYEREQVIYERLIDIEKKKNDARDDADKKALDQRKTVLGEIEKVETEAAQNAAKAQQEADEKTRELQQAGLEARNQGVADGNEAVAELRRQETEQLIEELNRQAEESAAFRDADREARQQYIEEDSTFVEMQLDAIDRVTRSEEESTRRKIELLKALLEASNLTAEQRWSAEEKLQALMKKAAADEKKTLDSQVKAHQDMSAKVVGITTNLMNILLDTNKSGSEKAKAIAMELTSMLAQEAAKQASDAIAAAIKKKTAAVGAIPAQVAEAHSGIPAPLGPIIAAAALAAFTILAQKVIGGFQEGTSGTVQDSVPGVGRSDSNTFRLNSRESVLNEDASSMRVSDLVRLLNRGVTSDQAAPSRSANGGTQTIRVIHEHGVFFQPTEDMANRAAAAIIPAINRAVTQDRMELTASHYDNSR